MDWSTLLLCEVNNQIDPLAIDRRADSRQTREYRSKFGSAAHCLLNSVNVTLGYLDLVGHNRFHGQHGTYPSTRLVAGAAAGLKQFVDVGELFVDQELEISQRFGRNR
ncbi:hypothetical protein D3C87_1758420 [compost metagenome]